MLGRAHVEMQDGVFRPFRFQLFHGQFLELLLPAFEIGFQGTGQQRLTETARTAQEHVIRR